MRALVLHARGMGINTPLLQFVWIQDDGLKTVLLLPELYSYKSTQDVSQIDAPKIVDFMHKKQEIYRFFYCGCKLCATTTIGFQFVALQILLVYGWKHDTNNRLPKFNRIDTKIPFFSFLSLFKIEVWPNYVLLILQFVSLQILIVYGWKHDTNNQLPKFTRKVNMIPKMKFKHMLDNSLGFSLLT